MNKRVVRLVYILAGCLAVTFAYYFVLSAGDFLKWAHSRQHSLKITPITQEPAIDEIGWFGWCEALAYGTEPLSGANYLRVNIGGTTNVLDIRHCWIGDITGTNGYTRKNEETGRIEANVFYKVMDKNQIYFFCLKDATRIKKNE